MSEMLLPKRECFVLLSASPKKLLSDLDSLCLQGEIEKSFLTTALLLYVIYIINLHKPFRHIRFAANALKPKLKNGERPCTSGHLREHIQKKRGLVAQKHFSTNHRHSVSSAFTSFMRDLVFWVFEWRPHADIILRRRPSTDHILGRTCASSGWPCLIDTGIARIERASK